MAIAAAGCGGESLVLPSEGEPAAIALVQGDGQSGRVGQPLPQPLVFEVTDATGRPVAGASVVVQLAGGDPDPDSVGTDASGRATVSVVLGPEVGTVSGSARVPTPDGQVPVETEFTVSAVAASANGLAIVSGHDQSAPAGQPLPEPLVVEVTDAFGNPIEGVTIAWTADGGGSVGAATTVTGADGRTSNTRTLGSAAGTQRTLAASEGLAGSPAAFLHTASAGSAAGVQIVSGDGQTAGPGERLPEPLVVRVADADGNPVQGAAVSWIVTGGGGALEPPTSTTGADGLASTQWVLGSAAGANSAEAVVSGVGSATFTATAVAGGASRIEVVSGNDQTVEAGRQLPADLVVRVTDASGNPVSGATVTWRVRSGGGSVAPGSSTTDASGQASARWTVGPQAGANTLEATAGGAGSVTFRATGTAAAPSALALRTQPSASADAGVPFGRQPVVQLQDASGNEVAQAGVAVTVAVASGSGALAGTATRSTDASGRASFSDLRITGATGTHTLIFAAPGFTSVTSDPIEVGPASTTTRITADTPDPSALGATVTVRFEVVSPGGTPTGTVRVTTSAGAGECVATVAEGSCELALGAAGDQTLTAQYEGSTLFEASAGTEAHLVEAPNQPPTAVDDAYEATAGQLLDVPAPGVLSNDGADPDGDPLVVEVAAPPATGTLDLRPDGGFSYTPAPDASGPVTFSYRVRDGRGGEATATVTVTVAPLPPT